MDTKIEIQVAHKKTASIQLNKFIFAEADSNYVNIYVDGDTPYKTIRLLLGELEDKINACGTYKYHHILRAGRKFIINTDYLVGVDVLNHKIKVQQPGQKVIELNLFKTEARKLYEQLERDKKAKVLQTISLRQKLTVPVSEINDTDEEWVNLGLTSGTLWASRNVDAQNPESAGTHSNWSSVQELSLPTREQWAELQSECVWSFCETNDSAGFLLIGPNGNALFLPCAGYARPQESVRDYDVRGAYWTATEVSEDVAYSFCFKDAEDTIVEGLDKKELSYSIRLVK